jgi:hypothetical protein
MNNCEILFRKLQIQHLSREQVIVFSIPDYDY